MASCRKSLQRIVRAAEKIVGVSLPSLQDIYSTRLTRKALCIAGDPTHPTHNFFSLLPSGRRLRSLQARTNRLKDSFIHQAVRKLNSLLSLLPLPSLTPRTTELWPPPPLPLNSDPPTTELWQENSLDKLFALHHLYSALFVCLSHWFALSTMCLMPLYPFYIIFLFIFLFGFIFIFFYMSLFVYL